MCTWSLLLDYLVQLMDYAKCGCCSFGISFMFSDSDSYVSNCNLNSQSNHQIWRRELRAWLIMSTLKGKKAILNYITIWLRDPLELVWEDYVDFADHSRGRELVFMLKFLPSVIVKNLSSIHYLVMSWI